MLWGEECHSHYRWTDRTGEAEEGEAGGQLHVQCTLPEGNGGERNRGLLLWKGGEFCVPCPRGAFCSVPFGQARRFKYKDPKALERYFEVKLDLRDTELEAKRAGEKGP